MATLKEGFEGAMNHENIEVGIVGADKKFKVLSPAEIKDYRGEVEGGSPATGRLLAVQRALPRQGGGD